MTLNKQNIFSSLILILYFVAHQCNREINGLIIQTSIAQAHASAGTEENPGWGFPAHI